MLQSMGSQRVRNDWVTEQQQFSGQEFERTPGDSCRTGKPVVLQSMGSQGVGHDLVTE